VVESAGHQPVLGCLPDYSSMDLNLPYSPAPGALGVGLQLGDVARLLWLFRAAGAQFPLPPPSRRRPDVVVLPARGFTLAWAGS
jgi:hypothetical protein